MRSATLIFALRLRGLLATSAGPGLTILRVTLLTRAVWSKASGGVIPETCESVLQVDSYRIRRLYAHWVETGALEPR